MFNAYANLSQDWSSSRNKLKNRLDPLEISSLNSSITDDFKSDSENENNSPIRVLDYLSNNTLSTSSSSTSIPRPKFDGSGLPYVCDNCGVSYFKFQVSILQEVENEYFCSGECRWSFEFRKETMHYSKNIPIHSVSSHQNLQ